MNQTIETLKRPEKEPSETGKREMKIESLKQLFTKVMDRQTEIVTP